MFQTMYNPSKRLQAIRRQLMQMDEQYKNGIDPGSHTGSESHTGSNANATPEKAQHMASNVNFMLSSTAAGHEQSGTIDNSMEFENEIETTDDCSSNNDDNDIPLSEELRTAILNIEDLDDVSSSKNLEKTLCSSRMGNFFMQSDGQTCGWTYVL